MKKQEATHYYQTNFSKLTFLQGKDVTLLMLKFIRLSRLLYYNAKKIIHFFCWNFSIHGAYSNPKKMTSATFFTRAINFGC